jgi:beta-glucosidase
LPAALDRRGGWLNPESANWFADYARILFRALDDRVKLWVTLNEPWVVVDGGYLHGVLAPGQRNPYAAPVAAHNLLRAHAATMHAYRAEGRHQIGLVVNLEPKYPASETVGDLSATMRADAYCNRYYLDPVFLGDYPPELAEIFGPAWPTFPAADLDFIRQPLDFLGINYYSRQVVRHAPGVWPLEVAGVRQDRQTHTALDWEVYPQGLTDILEWVASRYGSLPLYLTENGAAFYDPPRADDTVDDPLRLRYLRDHLRAALAALRNGVDLRGYFAWSLLDNFEWAHGYSKRFGLVHVDYATQQRTPKASARFYAEVIRTRGTALRVEGTEGYKIEPPGQAQ